MPCFFDHELGNATTKAHSAICHLQGTLASMSWSIARSPAQEVRPFSNQGLVFYSTMVMNYDTYLEIDQGSDSEFSFLTIVMPIEIAS